MKKQNPKTFRNKVLTTNGWRTFLDVDTNPRVESFLKERGYDVFNQSIANVHVALNRNWNELALLVHPNSTSIMIIKDSEFEEFLDFAMKWCEKNEYYELCSKITKINNKFDLNAKQQGEETTKG